MSKNKLLETGIVVNADKVNTDLISENMMLKEEIIILKDYKDTVKPRTDSLIRYTDRLTQEYNSLKSQLDNAIALPCKIEDKIYILANGNTEIQIGYVVAFQYSKRATEYELIAFIALYDGLSIHDFKSCYYYNVKLFNKTWFREREQAEQKLKEITDSDGK